MARRLGIAWVGLVAVALGAAGDGESPRTREVAVDGLDVFAEPDDASYVTARLARGDRVEVRRTLADGWLAIAPPEGSFHWVEADAVEALRDGRLYVAADKAVLRYGREGSPRPGPPRRMLLQGTVVRPSPRATLKVPDGRRRRIWRAVAAGSDEVRFVRAAGVFDPTNVARPAPRAVPAERRASHDEAAPAKVATDRIDAAKRADELTESAREFEELIRKSRRRDAEVAAVKESLRALREAEEREYDAEGLLVATSRRVDGEKVFALLDDEGRVVAYLQVPPGVNTRPLLARPVGVRGKSRFDEELKFRLLDVRDIEPLIPD